MTFDTRDSQREELIRLLADIKIELDETKCWIKDVCELIKRLADEDGKTDE